MYESLCVAAAANLQARQTSAETLVNTGIIKAELDLAFAVRLAQAAVKRDPKHNVRALLLNAASQNPVSNKFPPSPSTEFGVSPGPSCRSELRDRSDDPPRPREYVVGAANSASSHSIPT